MIYSVVVTYGGDVATTTMISSSESRVHAALQLLFGTQQNNGEIHHTSVQQYLVFLPMHKTRTLLVHHDDYQRGTVLLPIEKNNQPFVGGYCTIQYSMRISNEHKMDNKRDDIVCYCTIGLLDLVRQHH